MRICITGCTGFAGSHLAEYALKKGAEVWGVRRWRSDMANVRHIENDVQWVHGDLTDPAAVRKVLEESKPDWVFNLAAQSFVGASFSQPRETFHTNLYSQINLLHGLREGLYGKMMSCGSSEEYGLVMPEEIPIKETNPLRPLSPYAVSKCLTPQTKIFTDKGLVPISKIQIGDRVWTHKNKLRRVTNIFVRPYTEEMTNIRLISSLNGFMNNCQLTMTTEHPVLTDHGWVKGGDLKKADKVMVVASRCKFCNKLVPFWKTFCSGMCKGKHLWKNDETRKSITKALSEREKKHNYLHTESATIKRKASIRKYLQRKGINSHEFYIDLLINKVAPRLFVFVGDGKEDVNGHCPDWVNHQHKLIIEYNGWGYHSGFRDMVALDKRIKCFQSAGYKVLCLTEFSKPDILIKQVKDFVIEHVYDPEFIFAEIKKIRRYSHSNARNNKVYNLEVEKDNTYIAGGIVVHNCATDLMAYQYHKSYNLNVVRSRAFNHEGPRRGHVFVTSTFAKQIAEIEAGLKPKLIKHGNLEAKRDFSDVRDVVKAYWLLMEKGRPGEVYNIASGTAWPIHHVLAILVKLSSMPDIHFELDSKRLRPSDVPILQGDASKIENETGYKAEIPLEKTLLDTLNYWRNKIKT